MKKNEIIKQFEEFKNSIGNKQNIESKIKNLKKVPKELKEVALGLIKKSTGLILTKAENGKITGLQLHPDLKSKISKGGYPNGFDMGIDENGYFIHTHRARSKSHQSPDKISVKEIKFIDSTG